jgi:hypothetical protein
MTGRAGVWIMAKIMKSYNRSEKTPLNPVPPRLVFRLEKSCSACCASNLVIESPL